MATKKRHIIRIDAGGGVAIDAQGFVGRGCEETTQKLIAGLGATRTQDDKKPEYNQTQSTTTKNEVSSKW